MSGPQLVVGKIEFDISGQYYLATFDGTFKIGYDVLEAMAGNIKRENPNPPEAELAGRLARGVVSDGWVYDLSVLVAGTEMPSR